jgi:hypothetical protein
MSPNDSFNDPFFKGSTLCHAINPSGEGEPVRGRHGMIFLADVANVLSEWSI